MRISFQHALRTWALIAITLMLAAGCENVIQVELKTAEPQLVVSGYVGMIIPSGSHFRITRSTDFFEDEPPKYVDDARIIVTQDFNGYVDTLSWAGQGAYRFHLLDLTPGNRYHASVIVDGKEYTATTTMPADIRIDSVTAQYQNGGGIGTGEDRGYRLHVFFTDPPGSHEYARIKLWRGEHAFSDAYYLYDGKFSDGKSVDYNYFVDVYNSGDLVRIELMSIDETTYDYFSTLREVVVWDAPTNTFDVTPANPNTNWSGGALGFFGAFNVDTRGLLITDSTSTASEPGAKTQLMTDHPRSVR